MTIKARTKVLWRDMKEFTLVINHSPVHIVTIKARTEVLGRDMKESTLVIIHSPVHIATIKARTKDLWRDMKDTTLPINRSAAPLVKCDKSFSCSYCYNKFREKSWKHERIHTGNKSFSGSYCKKPFASMQKTWIKMFLWRLMQIKSLLTPYNLKLKWI